MAVDASLRGNCQNQNLQSQSLGCYAGSCMCVQVQRMSMFDVHSTACIMLYGDVHLSGRSVTRALSEVLKASTMA